MFSLFWASCVSGKRVPFFYWGGIFWLTCMVITLGIKDRNKLGSIIIKYILSERQLCFICNEISCVFSFFSISVLVYFSCIDTSNYLHYTYNNLQKLVQKNCFSHVSLPGRELSISEKTNKERCKNLCCFPLISSIAMCAVLRCFLKLFKTHSAGL